MTPRNHFETKLVMAAREVITEISEDPLQGGEIMKEDGPMTVPATLHAFAWVGRQDEMSLPLCCGTLGLPAFPCFGREHQVSAAV
jgi:hypothetical protein